MKYQGMTALITGASAGLGEEFAQQLAGKGANLILVARTEARLNTIADNLQQQTGVQVTVLPADLSSPEAVDRLISEVKNAGLKVDLLVNNAGLGLFENFVDTPLARQMQQVDVNVRAW